MSTAAILTDTGFHPAQEENTHDPVANRDAIQSAVVTQTGRALIHAIQEHPERTFEKLGIAFENDNFFYNLDAFTDIDKVLGINKASALCRARHHLQVLAYAFARVNMRALAGAAQLERLREFSQAVQCLYKTHTPFTFAARKLRGEQIMVVELNSLRHL